MSMFQKVANWLANEVIAPGVVFCGADSWVSAAVTLTAPRIVRTHERPRRAGICQGPLQ